MLIRPINESDNKQIAVILREVLVEMDILELVQLSRIQKLIKCMNLINLIDQDISLLGKITRCSGGNK